MKMTLFILFLSSLLWAQNPSEPVMPPENVAPPAGGTPAPGAPVVPGAPGAAGAAGEVQGEAFQATAPTADLKKEFFYNENEGRDPFKPYKDPALANVERVASTNPSNEKVLVRSIKNIAVPDEVILLGIVHNKDKPVAAIKVIDGKTYYMRKNDLIGKHEGRIVDITRNTVIVEQYREFDGQKNLEKIVLKFRKNEQN